MPISSLGDLRIPYTPLPPSCANGSSPSNTPPPAPSTVKLHPTRRLRSKSLHCDDEAWIPSNNEIFDWYFFSRPSTELPRTLFINLARVESFERRGRRGKFHCEMSRRRTYGVTNLLVSNELFNVPRKSVF